MSRTLSPFKIGSMVDSSPLNDLVHIDRFDSNFHLARFDLSEIEQAIDQIEQALSVIEKILKIFRLQSRDLALGFAQNQDVHSR